MMMMTVTSVNGQIISPYPEDLVIDVGDEECLHYSGSWSPAGGGGGGFGAAASPFMVSSDVPVILNRIIDGQSSRLAWGVPSGISIIVKSDCSGNNVLQQDIVPVVTGDATATINGQQIPKLSISNLPILNNTPPIAESRTAAVTFEESLFLPSSEFIYNYECFGQFPSECVPTETVNPVSASTPAPTAVCSASSDGNGSTNPPTPDNSVGGTTTPPGSNGNEPQASKDDNPSSSPGSGPDTATDSPTTSSTISIDQTSGIDDNDASSANSSSTKFSVNMLIGLVSTISLLFLGTGWTLRGGRTITLVSVTMVLILAALAVPSAYSLSSSGTNGGDSGSSTNHRDLVDDDAQCTINVEIVYWGCQYEVYVDAPAVTLRDNRDTSNDDWTTCLCQVRHEFEDIIAGGDSTNPYNNVTEVSDGIYHVSGGSDLSPSCNLAIGRPYRDDNGNIVTANVCTDKDQAYDGSKKARIWSAPASTSLQFEGDVRHNLREGNNETWERLGLEWTKRALGEHASIASFSAFTIALMSNQAPPDLIHDSLVAAQDELRHAKVSFELASLLLSLSGSSSSSSSSNTVVEPTALPPSKLQFDNKVTELALSTAQEGCIEETLSAIEMAVEYDAYSVTSDGNDEAVLARMIGMLMETTRTIALEEGNHSALAWRTIAWVCDSDEIACNTVQEQVLNPSNLVDAGKKRFSNSQEAQRIWECIWAPLLPIVAGGEGASQRDSCHIRSGNGTTTLSTLLVDKILSNFMGGR